MRILCFIDSLGGGGAQRQLVNVASGLKRRGHDVEVLTYHRDDYFRPVLDADAVSVHCDQKPHRWSLSPLFALRRMLRHASFEALLAYLETPAVYAELASFGLSPMPIVVSERSAVRDKVASFDRHLKSQLHRRATAVVCNTYSHADWLRAHFPFLDRKLVTIVNGVDTEAFRPVASEAKRQRCSGLHLLGVGRIAPVKNLPALASALGACLRSGGDVSVAWAGRVEDERHFQDVQGAIAAAGADKHWHWLGERTDIPELMRTYDALVSPSLYEGLPNVVCEALASGLPVLASDVSDNRLLVGNGDRGWTFSPDKIDELGSALAAFAALPLAERHAMSRRARAFSESALSLTTCVSAYERLLSSLRRRKACFE